MAVVEGGVAGRALLERALVVLLGLEVMVAAPVEARLEV